MDEAVIISAVRTPIGKYGKALAGFKATELGTMVVKEAVSRAGLQPTDIQECIMGNVLGAGLGQNPARQAAIGAGLPVEIGSFTVNAVCGSGMKAAMLAADAIKAQQYEALVVGGMESMSNAPYLMPGARWGYRMNDQTVVDSMVHDGLWDIFNNQHMGFTGEIVAERFNVTREDADRLSMESHLKAAKAAKEGKFKKEILPITIHSKKGDTVGTITLRDEFGNVRTAELIAAKDAAVQAWVIYAAAGLIIAIAAVCIALRKRSRAK